jgi:hypothetical protein
MSVARKRDRRTGLRTRDLHGKDGANRRLGNAVDEGPTCIDPGVIHPGRHAGVSVLTFRP